MPDKLLFLSNQYFLQSTTDALRRIAPPCETTVIAYDTFAQITQVYEQYAADYDAVFFSGSSAKHVIELTHPNDHKPLTAYQVDSDALHRDILRLAVETQNLDFHRIALDFMLPLGQGYSVADFLQFDELQPVLQENTRLIDQVGGANAHLIEADILQRILSLWQQGSIDCVLCLYGSLAPALEAHGVPFRCPFVSDGHLKRLIHDALVRLELNRLHENHPAIIQVFPRHSSPDGAQQLQQLHGALQQIIRENMLDCVLQQTESCCTLITSMKQLRALTGEFLSCQLSAQLRERLDFNVAVGYGVGTTVPHAMNNAQIASKEAKIVGQSFVVDSNGTLIGPLSSKKRMVISLQSLPDVSNVAKRCGLSAMTIQKLISIVRSTGSDKLTTQELAQRLDTTVRNANRIMLRLCRGGAARPVYTQTSHSRGRPIQVYALDLS